MTCLLSLLVLPAFKYNAKSISHILAPEYAGNPLQSISNEYCPAPQILQYACLAADYQKFNFFPPTPMQIEYNVQRWINFLMSLLEFAALLMSTLLHTKSEIIIV